MICNSCDGTGFANAHQLPPGIEGPATIADWVAANVNHDVAVCGCCGDGESHYGTPGKHYGRDDTRGKSGPYASNGGNAQCH